MPVHIHPTTTLAPRALLPGDPGRALVLAQLLLDAPKMFNHNRGLWGYTGAAADGEPLTIQSTGMGGPSAAIVLEELCDLGLQRAIRVGTCGALGGDLALGDLLIADAALATDGTSRALGAGERVAADGELVAALQAAAGDGVRTGAIVTSDLFYEHDGGRAAGWARAGALAIEMEAAALLRVAELRDVRAACVLAVSDVFVEGERHRIEPDALVRAAERLGALAAAALASEAQAQV
jgi:DeoD family purine-nucleoside phosphorylase